MFGSIYKLLRDGKVDRYILVGVFNTAIAYTSFPLIYVQTIFPFESYKLALILSFLVNVSIAFTTQALLVFGTTNRLPERLIMFFGFNLFLCFLNFLFLEALVSQWFFPPVYGQLIIVSIFVPFGYFFSRFVIFKN